MFQCLWRQTIILIQMFILSLFVHNLLWEVWQFLTISKYTDKLKFGMSSNIFLWYGSTTKPSFFYFESHYRELFQFFGSHRIFHWTFTEYVQILLKMCFRKWISQWFQECINILRIYFWFVGVGVKLSQVDFMKFRNVYLSLLFNWHRLILLRNKSEMIHSYIRIYELVQSGWR